MKNIIRIILSFFLIHCTHFTVAQGVSFELLDSVSNDISGWQKRVEGRVYRDFKGNSYTLSFFDENFKVWYYDKLASLAVYKENGGKDVLSLTENIDFSKATSITVGEVQNGITCLRVYFPKDYLKTQQVEGGKVTATVKESVLEFYCPYGTVDTDKKFLFDKMFYHLYTLAAKLKVEKKLMKEDDPEIEWRDWERLSSDAFLAKYSNSLLTAQAKENIKERKAEDEKAKKEEEAAALKRSQLYVIGFVQHYKYLPGFTLSQFGLMDPKNKDIVNSKPKSTRTDEFGNTYTNRENLHLKVGEASPFALTSDQKNTIVHLEYIVEKGSASKKAAKLSELSEELRRNVDKKYISETFMSENPRQLSEISVKVPGTGLSIKVSVTNSVSVFIDYEPYYKSQNK